MQFGGGKRPTKMEGAIGICSLMVKGGATDEKCYRYMQLGREKEAKPMKICSLAVEKRQNW